MSIDSHSYPCMYTAHYCFSCSHAQVILRSLSLWAYCENTAGTVCLGWPCAGDTQTPTMWHSHHIVSKVSVRGINSRHNFSMLFRIHLSDNSTAQRHDDIIKWKHFPRYWPFVRGIHRLLVDSPDKGQWRGALMFSLNCAWTNGWASNQDTGDLRCLCTQYDVTVSVVSNWTNSRLAGANIAVTSHEHHGISKHQ